MLKIVTTEPEVADSPRVTVLYGQAFDGWDMPPFVGENPLPWINGGVRAMIELAAGMAAGGARVELRGSFLESEVANIERATGVQIGRPAERRYLTADDTVIIPEGHVDPMLFARVALSPARAVIFIQAPLGLFGWSFDGRPSPSTDELISFDVSTVGRPEQLAAARAFGLELWTNVSGVADQAAAVGVPIHQIGSGRPIPYPEPSSKEIDVLVLGENRWSPLAQQVAAQLPTELKTVVLPKVSHPELLAALSLARVLIHPSRIEGRSRLSEEARAMRAVPVLLSSNTLGEGYGEQYGSMVVDSLEEMAPAVASLLADPVRVRALAENGYRTAREIGDWSAYTERLATALDTPDTEVAALAPSRAQFGASLDNWFRSVAMQVEKVNGQIAAAFDAINRERQALEAERASHDNA